MRWFIVVLIIISIICTITPTWAIGVCDLPLMVYGVCDDPFRLIGQANFPMDSSGLTIDTLRLNWWAGNGIDPNCFGSGDAEYSGPGYFWLETAPGCGNYHRMDICYLCEGWLTPLARLRVNLSGSQRIDLMFQLDSCIITSVLVITNTGDTLTKFNGDHIELDSSISLILLRPVESSALGIEHEAMVNSDGRAISPNPIHRGQPARFSGEVIDVFGCRVGDIRQGDPVNLPSGVYLIRDRGRTATLVVTP